MPRTASYFLAALCTLHSALCIVAADWPRFRGPNGAGVADPAPPTDLSAPGPGGWKVPTPGPGHGSPVVAAGRVFVQSAAADGSTRALHCLDAATGRTRWERTVTGSTAHIHKKNSLASGTPAVDGDRVFALFWDGAGVALHAYTTDGAPLWSAPLGEFLSDHGAGLSPVAFGGAVFVSYDQGAKAGDGATSRVLAFDAATGHPKWSAPRKAYRACSASPFVRARPGRRPELVVSTTAGVTGYDPDTGKVVWDWSWGWKGGEMALRTVGSAVPLADGNVFAVAGDGGGSRAAAVLDPGPPTKAVWQKRAKGDTPYVPTPLAAGESLFWLTDDGFAVCAAARTGRVVWKERAFPKGVTASPLLAGDTVLAFAEDGKMVAFRASPGGFDKVAEADLGEGVFASPAAADGRLYVRGFAHLFCFAGK